VNAYGIECWPSDDGNSFDLRRDCVKDLLRGVRDGKPAVAVSERCPVLRKGFNGGYCYKRLSGGAADEERYAHGPDKTNFYTHVMNAFEYLAWSLLKGNKYSGGIADFSQGGAGWRDTERDYASRVVLPM